MSNRKHELTTAGILEHVGENSFKRGERYAREGRVRHLRRTHDVIKCSCWGSEMQPYAVWATVTHGRIVASGCMCPVGSNCKHVAAMLLTHLEAPERAAEAQDLDALLNAQSKEELIATINSMIRQKPELKAYLELWLSGMIEKEDWWIDDE